MQIRRSRSAFELRIDVLEAIQQLGDDAIASRIALLTNTSQRALRSHLAFLQIKDLITVADHTVENRGVLKRRSISNVFRMTPKGNLLLSRIIPLREELSSDKLGIRRHMFRKNQDQDLASLIGV
jgi:predicted transcriptional regulator